MKFSVCPILISTHGVCFAEEPSFFVASVATILEMHTMVTLRPFLLCQTEQNHLLVPKWSIIQNMTFAFVPYNLHLLKNLESPCLLELPGKNSNSYTAKSGDRVVRSSLIYADGLASFCAFPNENVTNNRVKEL